MFECEAQAQILGLPSGRPGMTERFPIPHKNFSACVFTLAPVPVTISSWKAWRAKHPKTKVLSTDTGYERPYQPGAAYGEYFSSPELMFPVVTQDKRLSQKDYVFAMRTVGAEKA